jgi:hypothetical protein
MAFWKGVQQVTTRTYRCGFCDKEVASERGWESVEATTLRPQGAARKIPVAAVRICPSCAQPTYLTLQKPNTLQVPGPRILGPVKHAPKDVDALYEEARSAHTSHAFTAAVLTCRKILMHVAVSFGAKDGLRFIEYVECLDRGDYLGKSGEDWVDLIRTRSNDANHRLY